MSIGSSWAKVVTPGKARQRGSAHQTSKKEFHFIDPFSDPLVLCEPG